METAIMGLYGDYRVYIYIYIGYYPTRIMEKKMETTIIGFYMVKVRVLKAWALEVVEGLGVDYACDKQRLPL